VTDITQNLNSSKQLIKHDALLHTLLL